MGIDGLGGGVQHKLYAFFLTIIIKTNLLVLYWFMKKLLILISVVLIGNVYAYAQNTYGNLITKADSLYRVKNYKMANEIYLQAFKLEQKDKNDLYNAASTAALAGDKKNAFKFLNLCIDKGWVDLEHLKKDSDLTSLHEDREWQQAIAKLQERVKQIESGHNKEAKATLEEVYKTDQGIRVEFIEAQKKYGFKSKKVDSLIKLMNYNDSLNTTTVAKILDKYGWLGEDKVGNKGNTTLFLVIQHANLKTQQKYLPVLRKAVKSGKARASSLALLEDRVALREGRKQIYGSQLSSIPDNPSKYYLSPLIDPDNVDKRRASVGLQPLAEYVKRWDIVWNVEEYKKQLPQYEEWEKRIKR